MCKGEIFMLAVDKNERGDICIASSRMEERTKDNPKILTIKGRAAKFIHDILNGIKPKKITNPTTPIVWIPMNEQKPPKQGWYFTIEFPEKYELEKGDPQILKAWMKHVGMNKSYWSNNNFFTCDDRLKNPRRITKNVIFWANLPEVPDMKLELVK